MGQHFEGASVKASILDAVARGTLSRSQLLVVALAALFPKLPKLGRVDPPGRQGSAGPAAAAVPVRAAVPQPAHRSVATGPRWVNIQDYGAKGDGIADDTAAFREAIQAAKGDRARNIPGASIYLPGTYKVTSTINLSGISGLHFLGANSGTGWSGYLGSVPQTLINGTAIKTGPVFKLSSPADGSGSGGYHTLQNLHIAGGDVAVLITDTANHLLKNCSLSVNPGGTTDNVPLVIENTFWVRWEDGSATAVRGKPAVILRGKSPHVNVDVTYLIDFRKIILDNGAVVYEQNTNMTGQLPEHFLFDYVQTENVPAGTPLFDITKAGRVTGPGGGHCPWLRITMTNCNHYDIAGGSGHAPLLRLNRALAGGDYVQGVTFINCHCPGNVAIQTASGSVFGAVTLCDGGASFAANDAAGTVPSHSCGLVSSKGSGGFDFYENGLSDTGACIRVAKVGDKQFSAGIDGQGNHYWGPGGNTGGWDTYLQRTAPGVLGMPKSKAFNLPVISADPTSPANGMIWYNSTTHTLKCFVNGTVKTFAVT